MKSFLDASAATIKGIDPYHLVESGAQAEYTPGFGDFATVHSGPDIDVLSLHEYDSTLVVSHHLAPTLSAADSLGKPLIIGEVGIASGNGCTPTPADRAAEFRQKFDAYLLSGVAGVLIWNYTPNVPTTCVYSVSGGTGDPTGAMVGGYTAPAQVIPSASTGRLIARHSGKCLDANNGADHTIVTQQTCGGAASQTFTFTPTAGGFYEIVGSGTRRCFDVYGQSLVLKAQIQQWDCWGGDNQQFRFAPTDSGYYHLIGRGSTMCLDVSAASTADAATLQQYDCGTGANQQFRIG